MNEFKNIEAKKDTYFKDEIYVSFNNNITYNDLETLYEKLRGLGPLTSEHFKITFEHMGAIVRIERKFYSHMLSEFSAGMIFKHVRNEFQKLMKEYGAHVFHATYTVSRVDVNDISDWSVDFTD